MGRRRRLPERRIPAVDTLSFPGGKDNEFVVDNSSPTASIGACGPGTANCDSYTKGTATGDWATTKGSLGLTAYGLIFCTLAESQAINSNTARTRPVAVAGSHRPTTTRLLSAMVVRATPLTTARKLLWVLLKPLS